MLNQKLLSEIKKEEEFSLFLLINRYEVKVTKNGTPYLSLELRDKSASVNANCWENYDNLLNEITQNKIVKVDGVLQEFNGSPQIRIKKIRIAKENDDVRIEDFIPISPRPYEVMIKEFYEFINSIQNKFLKDLLELIFSEEKLEEFFKVPAGVNWHHSYIHGLLEHTLELVKICDLMCSIHKEINRDLLVTGALLHDFGKTEELKYDMSFDYTDKGKLLGHIMIGAVEVEKAIMKISNFPDELKMQLLHLILSHQGKYEYASPVIPKTLEAIVLYHADELSAKTNAYKLAISSEINKNGRWTKFIRLAETSLYIPERNDINNKSNEEEFL